MAKLSSINKNNRRKKMVKQYAAKWARLKAIASDESKPADERFAARLKMGTLPRNSHPTRVRNRCALTGRARGNYRKFGISRLMMRELASQGMIPGVTKSSW
jgi:small subunit ribosomal protein S14